MKTTFFALVMGCTLSISAVAATSYTVDPRHTFPSFEINHLGFSIQRGRFDQTSGKVLLNPESGTGSIHIAIETASISTGLAELEKHLRGEDFLDATHYPQITFVSDKLSFNKDRLVAADGILTLHSISKPVHLTVDYFYCDEKPDMHIFKPYNGSTLTSQSYDIQLAKFLCCLPVLDERCVTANPFLPSGLPKPVFAAGLCVERG